MNNTETILNCLEFKRLEDKIKISKYICNIKCIMRMKIDIILKIVHDKKGKHVNNSKQTCIPHTDFTSYSISVHVG